ncbi:hypothetical protein BCL76_106372 [Streptomyces sp. CG 926]|nr:hypothetical protein BCL76_106372 [Streptomyces sp. CG 926]
MNRYAFLAVRSAVADAPKAAAVAEAPAGATAFAPVLAAFDGARS